MIKPTNLNKGDKVALVSLSSGIFGEEESKDRLQRTINNIQNIFGLEVVIMPNALIGKENVYNHPELRAKDLMDAFKDDSIKAIICAIGGNDTYKLLPYIDYEVIRNNPKIFMGYSDTTVNHLMMNKAGLVSFYGPTIMCEFGEYVKMFDYTKQAVEDILFNDFENYEIKSSPMWSKDFVDWDEANVNKEKKLIAEEHGYEVLQGSGIVVGEVLGGCLEVFPMVLNTEIWPTKKEWEGKILLLETSEDKPSPSEVAGYLKDLENLGIYDVINGIIVGKPQDEAYYEEYKEVFKYVMREFNKEDLPIIYNVNIGHAFPTGILPLGTEIKIDLDNKRIFLTESPTKKIENTQILKR